MSTILTEVNIENGLVRILIANGLAPENPKNDSRFQVYRLRNFQELNMYKQEQIFNYWAKKVMAEVFCQNRHPPPPIS